MKAWGWKIRAIVFCSLSGLFFAGASPEPGEGFEISLPIVMRLAHARNLDVRIAQEKLLEARARHESAWWLFLPSFSPGIAYRRHDSFIQDVAGNIIDVHKYSYAPGLTITGQVDPGEAIFQELAARQLVEAARFGLSIQRQDSVTRAITHYFDLAKAVAAQKAALVAEGIAREYEQQIHRGVEAGITFAGDEVRVKIQREKTTIALRQAEQEVQTASARLAETLHLEPSLPLRVRDEPLVVLALVPDDLSLEELVQESWTRRLELPQNRALIRSARSTKNGMVYGPLLPSVGGQAFLGGLGGGRRDAPERFGDSQDVAIFFGWKIGPGGLFDRGRIEQSRSRLRVAELNEQKVYDSISREVTESVARVRSLRQQVQSLERTLSLARQGHELARQRKQFAVGVVLEDLLTQQDLARAEIDYTSAAAELNQAQYHLLRAVGRLDN